VNDAIPESASTIRYTSIDEIFDTVRAAGRGCYIIKRDIKDAFRNIPVAPVDRPLLAFTCEGKTYVECCLPFGLSTAPVIFNLFAEGLNWLLSAYLPSAVINHYLDDFISVMPSSPGSLHHAVTTFNNVYVPLTDALGIPRNASKDDAGTVVVVLGVEIDTTLLQARLSPAKLERAASTASSTLQLARVTQKALQRVLGLLQHCSMVVRLGRSRLQSLYNELSFFSTNPHAIRRLSHDSREDLTWWKDTLPLFNGIYLFHENRPAVALYTDACNSGLGLFFFVTTSHDHACDWRSAAPDLPYTHAAIINASAACGNAHINVKEVSAILQAFLLFSMQWAHHRVFIFTDSTVAYLGMSKQALRGPAHRPLLALLSLAAAHDIEIQAHWLSTSENQLADALSRSDFAHITDICPQWEDCSRLVHQPGSPAKAHT
jgi:hypothetical protein